MVEQGASKLVQETALGAIAVLAVVAAGYLFLRCSRLYDAWIKDKDAQASRAELSNEKDRERSDKHTEAIRDLAEAIRDLTRAQEASHASHESLRASVERLYEFLKLLTKSSGSMPAVRRGESDR